MKLHEKGRQMQPKLRRVRAMNPSAMTGSGTNSYILGQGQVAIIDPGPDEAGHLRALLAALDPGETVAAILVSHAHLDHSGLVPQLSAATGAPVYAFGRADEGRSAVMQALVLQGLRGGGEGVDLAFAPDRRIAEGDDLSVGGLTIEVLHTPGHMAGHLCFACDGLLFSGDHAMGWATSLVSPPDGDMGDYMASLDRLAARSWRRMLPGHGDEVADPAARLAELRAHRRQREAEVLAELTRAPGTAAELAARIYREVSPALLPAASRNVLAHLIDLATRNHVVTAGQISAESAFHPN